MVEYTLNYDDVFHALSDRTRRDILQQLAGCEKTITEIAQHYAMSFAAVAKHLQVLESASLVFKRKHGRSQVVSANPLAIAEAADYLKKYEMMWNRRFNTMESLLKEGL